MISHFVQHPLHLPVLDRWHWPTAPAWGYALTQGLHVTSGVASIPLLAIKLWTVAPKF